MPLQDALVLFQLLGPVAGAIIVVAGGIAVRRADRQAIEGLERKVDDLRDECRDGQRAIEDRIQRLAEELGVVKGAMGWKSGRR